MPMPKILLWGGLGLLALLLLIQLVPYGRDHADPKATRQVRLPNAHGEQLFQQACADCHSDHTEWRWYDKIAPVSWLVQRDIDEGRRNLNLSEWDRPQPDVDELAAQISSGEMPPLQYKAIHPAARLSDAEKRDLIAAFRALYAANPPASIGGGG